MGGGGTRCDALRRREPPQPPPAVAARAEGGLGDPGCGAERVDARGRGEWLGAQLGGAAAVPWKLPWQDPPSWLYLPHLGIGDGTTAVEAVSNAERRRATGADELDLRCGGEHSGGAASHASHMPAEGYGILAAHAVRGPRGAEIRGHCHLDHLPGAEGANSGAATGSGEIRGLPGQPGASAAATGATLRQQLRLAAQHSTIQRSLDDHAERVARKRLADGPAAATQPSASSRLAALRQRVAARAAAPTLAPVSLPAPAAALPPLRVVDGVDDAAAHAAARDAEHGVGHPRAGLGR
jgi:hypothetical protein